MPPHGEDVKEEGDAVTCTLRPVTFIVVIATVWSGWTDCTDVCGVTFPFEIFVELGWLRIVWLGKSNIY